MPRSHFLGQEKIGWRSFVEPFLHRHGPAFSLNDHERALLESSAIRSHTCDPGTHIRRQNDLDSRPFIVASGWGCYARSVRRGHRQIFDFILPGDTIGLAEGPYAFGGSEIVALTAIVLLGAWDLKRALSDAICPNLKMALHLERVLHEARLLDHVVRLGQLSSLERTAHLLLELHHRIDKVGLVQNRCFQLPVTQIQMGQALGLSQIQMHRTLHSLRRDGLLTLDGRGVTLPDLERLAWVAGCEVSSAHSADTAARAGSSRAHSTSSPGAESGFP
jgi:CRP-like cAMP-binding protein